MELCRTALDSIKKSLAISPRSGEEAHRPTANPSPDTSTTFPARSSSSSTLTVAPDPDATAGVGHLPSVGLISISASGTTRPRFLPIGTSSAALLLAGQVIWLTNSLPPAPLFDPCRIVSKSRPATPPVLPPTPPPPLLLLFIYSFVRPRRYPAQAEPPDASESPGARAAAVAVAGAVPPARCRLRSSSTVRATASSNRMQKKRPPRPGPAIARAPPAAGGRGEADPSRSSGARTSYTGHRRLSRCLFHE